MTQNQLALLISEAVVRDDPDVRAILERIAKWQHLFSPGPQPYTLTGYEDLYVQGADDLIAYDNYAERDTKWFGFATYRRIWEREINTNFPGFIMNLIEVDRVEVSGDLAWTAFTWYGSIITPDGAAYPAQHSTHGWRRVDGVWKIAHEHLTSGVKYEGVILETEHRSGQGPNAYQAYEAA
ncbi:MAG: nuclear transport factor 2 family protein [Pseudomonadota bacterium]